MDIFINATNLKSLITFFHLAGLALGLGGAWILDLFIFKHLSKHEITQDRFYLIHFISKLVMLGLIVLWVSGFLFIAHYYWFSPEYLFNEKVWAKVFIVVMLTVNGFAVHRLLLPKIKNCINASLFCNLPKKDLHFVLSLGAISFVSWLFPVVLGVTKTLNFTVPALTIAYCYLAVVFISLLVSNLALEMIAHKLKQSLCS